MRFLAVFLLLALSMPAYAAADDIPESIQGKWVGGGQACDTLGAPMVISATTLVYADGRIDDVFFSPEDGADGTVHFRAEGEVSNYEYIAARDLLVYHPEGFGMGSALPMVRCAEPAGAFERRCGWLANPTPGNWWLIDRDRSWTLSSQGDDNPAATAVMDRVPAFDADEFVSTGSYYGHGCACLTVTTDPDEGRVLAIGTSKRLPLATCEADTSLPLPADW
ncbi:DUF4087 domain-containing protein [Devosia sp. Root635]|uniref:DUF4087 domain-containing protein n=1 Tax=Devosia sp. Root635 TaxID=1736575 RepID=UPI000ADBADF0|nr:DUF4087 domain-containing protein [Devosia sp. Root635]